MANRALAMGQPQPAGGHELSVGPMDIAIKRGSLAMAGQCLRHRVGQAGIAKFRQTTVPEGGEGDVLRQVRRISNAACALREEPSLVWLVICPSPSDCRG
jgi:hypothetical protein